MATPINAPMAGEIWHLSIEDLFQPVQEAPRLGGEGPFVINLSVSTAPISLPTKEFAGCRDAHVYQIQVTEDGRTRYRLRLGPFMDEDRADAILAEVRDTYPGALTATASASDLRVIGTMQAKIESRQISVPKPAEKAAPEKVFPEKAVSKASTSEKPAAVGADPEISIDIAWPTPELVVPRTPPRAAPTVMIAAAPKAEIPPAAVAPSKLAPQWTLPELDIPLPNTRGMSPPAKASPALLTEAVAPTAKTAGPKPAAPKPAAPKIDALIAVASLAPLLTEVVAPATKASAPKIIAPIPVAIAAPVLRESVAPKPSAPVASASATIKAPVPVLAPAPVLAPKSVAPPVVTPPAPVPVVVTPAAATRITATTPAPAKRAAPKAADKPPTVLTQSVASAPKASAMKRQSAFKHLAARLTSLQHVVVATAPAPAAREVKKLEKPLDSLESTQTMRALTLTELEDEAASRWFVIQLALADHGFDPDAVPNLDIFSEYRLYSVAGLDQGRVVHALRLGFFREEIGAVAVASYLAAYWDKPTIKRVSLAERERFADQRVEARKDVGATGKHAVIEITDELVARRKRASKSSSSAKMNQTGGH
jgi:hypothetical protein